MECEPASYSVLRSLSKVRVASLTTSQQMASIHHRSNLINRECRAGSLQPNVTSGLLHTELYTVQDVPLLSIRKTPRYVDLAADKKKSWHNFYSFPYGPVKIVGFIEDTKM